jgi:MFS family permease
VQLPFLLSERFGLGGTMIGVVIASATLTAAVASSLYRRIRTRRSIREVYTLLLLFYGIGFLGIGFAPGSGSLQFFAVVSGFGMGWFMVNSHTWMLERAHPAFRGRASGFMATAIFLGQFASPVLVQPIIDIVGTQKTFAVIGAVMFVWLIALLLQGMVKKKSQINY